MDFFFSSRRRHTRSKRDWSSDVCSSDLRSESTPSTAVGEWIRRRVPMTTSLTSLETILAHPRELSPANVEIVRETLPVIGGHIDEIAPVFYRTMFDAHPELEHDRKSTRLNS